MLRTLLDIKNSRLPEALNMCATDSRFVPLVNEALEWLISQGAFWGLFGRYRFQTTQGLLVFPRQVASVLSVALSNVPIRSRDMFFEFMGSGIGVQNAGDCQVCSQQLLDRGNTPVFEQISGVVSKVKVYRDLLVDDLTPILILGYDENGNWIRTLQGPSYQDGEIVLASAAGTLSTNIFSVVTGVQKPVTSGYIRLYAYDTVATTQSLMAVYEYDITNPSYRVFYVPWLASAASEDCPIWVDTVVKLAFVPVRVDTDFMMISSIPALKTMCRAVLDADKEGDGQRRNQILMSGLGTAKLILEAELRHERGNPEDVAQILSPVPGCPVESLV
jgi:hypothetical protein